MQRPSEATRNRTVAFNQSVKFKDSNEPEKSLFVEGVSSMNISEDNDEIQGFVTEDMVVE